MTMTRLEKEILSFGSIILSEGTQNIEDLLTTCYDFFRKNALNDILCKKISDCFTEEPSVYNRYFGKTKLKQGMEEEASELLNEDIFNYLNDLAPDGYCFSSHEGDGACYGFWAV